MLHRQYIFISLVCCWLVFILPNCKSPDKEASIILFNGDGTSPNDVKAIRDILQSNHMDYVMFNSAELNKLDTDQLKKYKLLIMPGGNFIEMGKGLTAATTANVRQAVHNGLNYLGICAGGFLAGETRNNSFGIAGNSSFKFYAAEDSGTRKTVVRITNADGTTIDQYWEDGPQFSGWGQVLSTYPDGTPAAVQGSYGAGWIVLTGVHAEAPASWRNEFHFTTPIEVSHAYAVRLIRAALDKTALPHY